MKEKEIKILIYKKIEKITESNEDWLRLSIKNWDDSEKERYIKAKANLGRIYAYFIDYLDKEFNLKDKKILDLGCGFGNHSFLLYEKGAKVFALDIEKEFVEVVNLKKKLTNYNIFTITGNGFFLPFKQDSFDGVICTHTIEHIRDPQKFLQEIHRVLKKGGFLYLTLPNYLFPYEPHFKVPFLPFLPKNMSKFLLKHIFYRKGLKKIRKKWEDIPFLEEFLYELNFIKSFSLENLLKKTGFKIYKKNFTFPQEIRSSKKLILKKILMSFSLYPFETRFIVLKE